MRHLLILFTASTILLCTLSSNAHSAEHSESKSRWFNLRVMPIGMALGEFMGDFGISPLSFLDVGIIGYSVNGSLAGGSAKGRGAGGRLAFHFSTTRNDTCWFLSLYYYAVNKLALTKQDDYNETATQNFVASEGGLLLGKMWVWDSGFNMSLAFGLRGFNLNSSFFVFPSQVKVIDTTSISPLKIEYTLGWAF